MLYFDARWIGQHGIGRFAQETRLRLPGTTKDIAGHDPVSLEGLIEMEVKMLLMRYASKCRILFSPGYAPPIFWRGPFIFTIHDLIHLDIPEEGSRFKNIYYRYVVRPATLRASKVLTVSEYSRQRILKWSGMKPEKVIVVGNGVDPHFSPKGPKHMPGYPYIFYVRNTKPHKNVPALLEAFAKLNIPNLRLLLSGSPDDDTRHLALRLGIYDHVVFTGRIPEEELPAYYRGAAVVTMPSLYEGFGLPALEGMACGVPVVVSNTTSLPEVVGDAGILVNPHDTESIADGLNRALTDESLRTELRRRGLERAKLFNWDRVADKIHEALSQAGAE